MVIIMMLGGVMVDIEVLFVVFGCMLLLEMFGLEMVGLEFGGMIVVDVWMCVFGYLWLYVVGDFNGCVLFMHMGKY